MSKESGSWYKVNPGSSLGHPTGHWGDTGQATKSSKLVLCVIGSRQGLKDNPIVSVDISSATQQLKYSVSTKIENES